MSEIEWFQEILGTEKTFTNNKLYHRMLLYYTFAIVSSILNYNIYDTCECLDTSTDWND